MSMSHDPNTGNSVGTDGTRHGIVQVSHNSDILETEDWKNMFLQGFLGLNNL